MTALFFATIVFGALVVGVLAGSLFTLWACRECWAHSSAFGSNGKNASSGRYLMKPD